MTIYTVFLYTFGKEKHVTQNIAVLAKLWANLFSKFVLQSVQSPESIFKLRAVLPAYNATVLPTFKDNQSIAIVFPLYSLVQC